MLGDKKLKYYKSEKHYQSDQFPKGVLNFQQIWIEPIFKQSELKIDLAIVGTTRIFFLKCYTEDEYFIWMKRIKHSIDSSIGKLNKTPLDNTQLNYWRYLKMTEEGIKNEA